MFFEQLILLETLINDTICNMGTLLWINPNIQFVDAETGEVKELEYEIENHVDAGKEINLKEGNHK